MDLGNSQEEDYKLFLDRLIRINRDVIILSILYNKPMCGYDVIKEILQKYDVFLSQGSVYSMLYTLEEEGIIHAKSSKGDMRAKIYSLTPLGMEIVPMKLDDFTKVMEAIFDLIKDSSHSYL